MPDPEVKQKACNEIEAHESQISFCQVTLAFFISINFIEPGSADETSVLDYIKWLQAELETFQDLKEKNT